MNRLVSKALSSLSFQKKLFVNYKMKLFSQTDIAQFGAKKIAAASKGSAGGNKVKNVSIKRGKSKEKNEEEEQSAEEYVEKNDKKKVSKKVPPKQNKVVGKKPVAQKKQAPARVEEEEEEAEMPVQVKSNKIPQRAAHTLKTQPKKESIEEEGVSKVGKKLKKVETPLKKVETTSKKIETQPKKVEKISEPEPEQEIKPKRPNPFKKKEPSPYEFPQVDLANIGRVKLETELDPKKYTTNPSGLYEDYIREKTSQNTRNYIVTEKEFVCNNYAPLPVVCAKGSGVYLQDVDGHIYIDFLSAYSAVNHGHGDKNIIKAAYDQMNLLHMTSRAFYNNVLVKASQMICKLFDYEKVLFMNSGVEAGESAVKIARRWGYNIKGIENDKAKIVFANGNFWGRSLYACATSDDPSRYEGFGPFDRSTHYMVDYGNIQQIYDLFEKDHSICAVFIEPIQGEGGVVLPPQGYFQELSNLCKKYNVLLITDEIQTGIGRTGYLLASQMDNVKADIVLLGKSLSGGLYPVSAVLASKQIMDTIKPGEHGSTYGGNPLAAQICFAALNELLNQPLIKNSYYRGIEFGLILKEELENNKLVKEVRGRGLMYAIELHPECGIDAYDLSLWLMERGILCKPTKKHVLRLSPPLVINEKEIERSADIISSVLNRAQEFVPMFNPQTLPKFNIPSSNSIFENQFVSARRARKLNLTTLNPQKTTVNPISFNIDKSNLNPENDIMTPLQQIQQNNHINESAQEAASISLDQSSFINPIDLLNLKHNDKEVTPEQNELEAINFKH